MKRFTTHVTLAAALLLSMTSTALKAQISDAPTTGEYVTIQLSQTKDKVLYAGVFAPDNDIWIDLNGDGECQPKERIGRNTERPEDYTDVFYDGPKTEIFELVEGVQTLRIYGKIEALRFSDSETHTSPKSVDLSQCTALRYFKLYECMDLETITPPLPENDCCEMLSIQYTPLQTLDLSSFKKLLVLVASFNKQLESVKLAECPKMFDLDCSFTKISKIDLSKVPALTGLYLCMTQHQNIDLSLSPNLQLLSLGGNYLKNIDLSKTPKLTNLSLFDNELTTIDVSMLPNLEILELEQNNLKTVDVSKNKELKELTMHINNISDLDLSMLPNLHLITLSDNNISEEAMGKIVSKIPQCKEFNEDGEEEKADLWGHCYIVNTPSPTSNVCNTLQVAELKKKGWTPYDVNGTADPQGFMTNAVEYAGSTPTGICSPIDENGVKISQTATGVQIQGLNANTHVYLFNTSGEMLQRYNSLRSDEVNIPTEGYPAGTYFVAIGNKSYKVIFH